MVYWPVAPQAPGDGGSQSVTVEVGVEAEGVLLDISMAQPQSVPGIVDSSWVEWVAP